MYKKVWCRCTVVLLTRSTAFSTVLLCILNSLIGLVFFFFERRWGVGVVLFNKLLPPPWGSVPCYTKGWVSCWVAFIVRHFVQSSAFRIKDELLLTISCKVTKFFYCKSPLLFMRAYMKLPDFRIIIAN